MNQLAGGQINTVVVRAEGEKRLYGPWPSESQSEKQTGSSTAVMLLFLVPCYNSCSGFALNFL